MTANYRMNGLSSTERSVGAPKLSICIATYNRAGFIGDTLESILCQLEPDVELIVVDGASPDDTPDIVGRYLSKYPHIRYHRESSNSGIDADYDKAVAYATGEYCWLMTDDDLLLPGAVKCVLATIDEGKDLIIVNAEIKDATLSRTLEERRLHYYADREFDKETLQHFFADATAYISFIGCVVIRRSTWLSRDRSSFYGTLFVHVGVIFQSPAIDSVKVIANPLIVIRYGNAMWTPRGFEIWMFKWPRLVWSFSEFPEPAKQAVCQREPWRNLNTLFYYRATGAYSAAEFREFLSDHTAGFRRVAACLIAVCPAPLANFVIVFYRCMRKRVAPMGMYDLTRSRHARAASRLVAKAFGA